MVEMGFVQIIEFQTSRLDEVEALGRDISDKLDDGRPSSPTRTTIVADPNHHRRRPGPAGLLPEHRRVRVVRSRHGELEPSGDRRIRGPAGEALRFSSQVPQPGCARGLAVLEPHVSGHRT